MKIQDYRFFSRMKYQYAENYDDPAAAGPTSENDRTFYNADEAIEYAHSQGFTFRDSKGVYHRPGSTRYWVTIRPVEEDLNFVWTADKIYEHFDITKYSGDRHLAVYIIAGIIKTLTDDDDKVVKYSLTRELKNLSYETYWKLITPNQDNKDFSEFLVARNENWIPGQIYKEDKQGLAKFLQTVFLLAVRSEVIKITDTIIEEYKDNKVYASTILRDMFDYVKEKYYSKWL